MKTIKLLSIGLFFSGALFLASCKDKEGCTNPKADNYSREAKVSNKSCIYTAEIIFWFEENASLALQGSNVEELNFLLNEESIGKASTDQFWEEAPECDDSETIKYEATLEKASFEPFHYRIIDKDSVELWEGFTELTADSCRIIHLK